METQKNVCGMYKSQKEIDLAVEALKSGKFKVSSLAVVLPSGSKSEKDHSRTSSTIVTRPFDSILADVMAHEPLPSAQNVLTSLGISRSNANLYEERLKDGEFLLSVPTPDSNSSDSAKRIFKRTGAKDIAATKDRNLNNENIN